MVPLLGTAARAIRTQTEGDVLFSQVSRGQSRAPVQAGRDGRDGRDVRGFRPVWGDTWVPTGSVGTWSSPDTHSSEPAGRGPAGMGSGGRAVPCSHRPVLPASGSDSCPELPRGRRGDLPPPSRPTGDASSLPAAGSSFRLHEGDNRAHSLTFLNQRKHGDLK